MPEDYLWSLRSARYEKLHAEGKTEESLAFSSNHTVHYKTFLNSGADSAHFLFFPRDVLALIKVVLRKLIVSLRYEQE